MYRTSSKKAGIVMKREEKLILIHAEKLKIMQKKHHISKKNEILHLNTHTLFYLNKF